MDIIITVCQYFLLPALLLIFTYFFGKYRERTSRVNVHDQKIFEQIDSIINDREVTAIVSHAESGYLPEDTYSKADALSFFMQNPANQFIEKETQIKFLEFAEALSGLSQLYAGSSYSGTVDGVEKLTKLVYEKRGNIDNEETDLIRKNLDLTLQLEVKYQIFRLLIKKRFCV